MYTPTFFTQGDARPSGAHRRWPRAVLGRVGVALTALLTFLACDDTSTSPQDGSVATVVVTATTDSLEAGATLQLTATARSASGGVISGLPVAWASSDPTVAGVGPTGRVTGIRVGTVTAEATISGERGTFSVRVTTNPAPVAGSLAPASAVAGSGGLTLTVHGTGFTPSAVVSWNGAERPTTWVSTGELRATISGADLAQAGTAQVRVVNEGPGGGPSAPLAFTVSPAPVATLEIEPADPTVGIGDSIRLSAVARDALGQVLQGRAVTWTSGREDVATVSAAGWVRGLGLGAATVTATSEGKWSSTVVTVEAADPVITSLSPDSVPARADSLTITIHGRGFTPSTVAYAGTSRPTDFVSPTELRMFFFSGDLATNGVRQVFVRDPVTGGRSGPAPFLVRGITWVQVTGERHLWVGEAAVVTAEGRDWEGNAYPWSQPVTWTSSRPEVATVDARGIVRGVAVGTAEIRGTLAGLTGAWQVQVLTPPRQDLVFEAALGDPHVPQLWRATLGSATPPTLILPPGTWASTPAVTRDGKWIAYQGGDGQIWVVKADGTGRRVVTVDSLAKDQPAWSPDGTRIAFRARGDLESEIGIVNADGSGQKLLTVGGVRVSPMQHEEPTWTPDGSRILFARAASNFHPLRFELTTMRPDGTDLQVFVSGSFSDTDPAYSPDGTKLAVARIWYQPPVGRRLTILDAQGHPAVMTNYPGAGREPGWSTDGFLAYIDGDIAGNLVITRAGDTMHKVVVGNARSLVWIPRP